MLCKTVVYMQLYCCFNTVLYKQSDAKLIQFIDIFEMLKLMFWKIFVVSLAIKWVLPSTCTQKFFVWIEFKLKIQHNWCRYEVI